MNRSLSDLDIKKYIPNVILYSDLRGLTPRQLVEKLPVVILYTTTLNSGHWTLLHMVPEEGLEFFDSYSSMPDEEFKYMLEEQRQPHYLARLLKDINEVIPINYNNHQLQKLGPGINTCGRWVILRYLLGKYKIDDFVNGITKMSEDTGIDLDQIVTNIITLETDQHTPSKYFLKDYKRKS